MVRRFAGALTDILRTPWTDGEGREVSFVLPPSAKVQVSEFSPAALDLAGKFQT